MFDIKKLERFPAKPGVYLMKGKGDVVLYVGKAKNLRARVKQYFMAGGDGRFMVPFLVSKVENIETIIVSSEKEALLLENNLIKQYLPAYNALLKDDKTYIALKVNNKNNWPMVQLVRYRGKPKADGLYFGPYTSAHSARTTLDLLQRMFPLRQCSDQELARRKRPCILYDMKRCIAPCVSKCTREEYDSYVEKTIKFLRGHDKEILKDLYARMEQQSETLEFEEAAGTLRLIRQLEKTIEGQAVDKPFGGDTDAIGLYRQADEVMISILFFREGKLMGSRHHNFNKIAEDDEELLESFLLQIYERQELPQEILVPKELSDSAVLAEIFTAKKSKKVTVAMPQRGEKKSLIEMAHSNAEASFKKEKDESAIRERTLMEMQEKLHLSRYPERIECFDNSSIAGTDSVSVLVAFTDGLKDTKHYRKYKIRSVKTPDDYATMYEVLTRRYKKAKEENLLPDLVIVDGGKGHLNIALKVFAELNIITVDLIGIAKESGRHDKGMSAEQIFLPNVKDPILLRANSPILFLLQKIRDEAHRFAITFHRKRRSKGIIKTALADIPGIGPMKRKILLQTFGSVRKMCEAGMEEIKKIKIINKKDLIALEKFIQSEKGKNEGDFENK